MNILTKTIKPTIAVAILVLVGFSGASLVYAQTQSPPLGNTNPPINDSATGQVKSGGLSLGSLIVGGNSIFTGFVGIGGTGAPEYDLDIEAQDSSAIIRLQNSNSNYDSSDGAALELVNNSLRLRLYENNNLIFYTGNSERMRIKGSGDVGIGTGSSIATGLKLDVAGQVGATAYCDGDGANCSTAVDISNVIAGGGAGGGKWADGTTAGTIVYNTGKVGIGVTDPVQDLDVNGIINLTDATGNDRSAIDFGRTNGGLSIYNKDNSPLTLGTTNTARLTIDDTGDVGIGDPTPDTGLKLDVEGQIGATAYCDENGANCTTPAVIAAGGGGLWSAATVAGDIQYSSGEVGIGTNDPIAPLQINQTSTTAGARLWRTVSGDGRAVDLFQPSGSSNPFIWSTGNSFQWRVDTVDALTLGTDGAATFGAAVNANLGLNVDGKQVIHPFTGQSITSHFSTDSRYGYFNGYNNSGDRGFYLGYGNGAGRVDLIIDAASQLYINDNVSIGTTNQNGRLTVDQGGGTVALATGSNTSDYRLEIGANDDGANFTAVSAGRGFNFKNNNGELVTIESNGRFQVNAGARFHTDVTDGDFYVRDTDKGSVSNVLWYDHSSGRVYLGNTGATTGVIPEVTARGNIGADAYCDQSGNNCTTPAAIAGAAAGGDNLGNHIATQTFNLGGNSIDNFGSFTASTNPAGGSMTAAWEDNYWRYRFGGTAATLGLRIDNYDTTRITLGRDGNIAATGWIGAGCESYCDADGNYVLAYPDRLVSYSNTSAAIAGYNTGGANYGGYFQSSSNYGLVGRTTLTASGGILGYSADASRYGILGYANDYALYGVGNGYFGGAGDVIVYIDADTDNVTESDNPTLFLRQDGAAVVGRLGINSGNVMELVHQYNAALRLGTNNIERVHISAAGDVGIGAVPGGVFDDATALAIGDSDTGIRQNGDGVLEIWSNNQEVAQFTTGGFVTNRYGTAGTYSASEVQGIWSIGDGYQANLGTNTFGSQYGLGYSYDAVGGGVSGQGHQIHFINNGSRNATISVTTGDGLFRNICDTNGGNCTTPAAIAAGATGDNLGAGGTTIGTLYSSDAGGFGYIGQGPTNYTRWDTGGTTFYRKAGAWRFYMGATGFYPYTNNTMQLGNSSQRFSSVAAGGASFDGQVEIGTPAASGDALILYGLTAGAYSRLFTSNGNLHIDSALGTGGGNDFIYLGYYSGNGTRFGGGASNTVAEVAVGGHMRAGFGGSGTPGLSFYGDTNTGFFRQAENVIGISTGGAERARFEAEGINLRNNFVRQTRGVYLGWSTAYGLQFNHGLFSHDGSAYSDDILLNSYGNVRINIDSNNNDGGETFEIGNHTTDGTSNTFFTVDNTGAVGIGDPTPDAGLKVDVSGNVGASAFCNSSGTSCSTAAQIAAAVAGGGLWTDGGATTYLNGDNVAIGATSASYELDVDGDVSADAFIYSSDRRLKTNLSSFAEKARGVLGLNTYEYFWKDSGEKDFGVIAQEVEKTFPELVITGDDGYKAVDYAQLVVPLLEVAKQQQSEIDELRGMINKLQNN